MDIPSPNRQVAADAKCRRGRAQQLIPQAKLPADELQGVAAAPPGQVMSQVEACVQVT
ncbi:MAG: hypothetical protein ABIW57_00720 [Polyangia bacterium]